MTGKIHALVGFTLGINIAYKLQLALSLTTSQYLICVAVTTLGSLLPDIDTPHSSIGRRFKIISYPIYKVFGHRTITHSLFVWTLLLFMSPFLNTGLMYGVICISVYGGVISHLMLDTISTMGIPIIYPLCNIRFHLIPHLRRGNKGTRKIKT